ncbi:MAG: transposase, partial [Candidatus Nitrosopolaris sp.]
ADFTQADVQDNQRYPAITSSLPTKVRYVAADSGYDDHKLYKLSTDKGFEYLGYEWTAVFLSRS